ncbi:hypothetical protein KQX54_004918 [Cotesia glomerata]|uniref:Uncharacterized protein n=1 Tax=Cotesia glomerata TaxID=32391 RepID=A0AAV7IEV7_COTGL|nr:hypothetical protein KQX54_004918 [Cotesia glomerata]
MYAIENGHSSLALSLIEAVKDHEWINARDSDGYPATHYRLLLDDSRNSRCFNNNDTEFKDDLSSAIVIRELLDAGADVNATINNDPNSLLINIAALKHFPQTLCELLPYYDNTSKSTALHYLLRPPKTPQTESTISTKRACIALILKNIIYRRTFGFFVPEDEKILMDKLIAEDTYYKKLTHTYKQNDVQGELKTKVLKYDDKTITYYDFIMSCFNDKKLRLIVQNKSLMDAFENTFPNPHSYFIHMSFLNKPDITSYSMECFNDVDYFLIRNQISIRIKKTSRRLEQLKALKKIENLYKAIPLPYELAFYL